MLGGARVFCMLNDWKVDLGGEAQGLAHDRIVQNGLSVITDRDSTRTLKSTKIRKHCALTCEGSSGYGEDIYHRSPVTLLQPSDPFWRINDRKSVGHATNRSKATGRRGGRSRGDSFFIALAGFPQMYVQVDKSW